MVLNQLLALTKINNSNRANKISVRYGIIENSTKI